MLLSLRVPAVPGQRSSKRCRTRRHKGFTKNPICVLRQHASANKRALQSTPSDNRMTQASGLVSAFSPTGDSFVVATADGRIRMFDTGKEREKHAVPAAMCVNVAPPLQGLAASAQRLDLAALAARARPLSSRMASSQRSTPASAGSAGERYASSPCAALPGRPRVCRWT